MEHKNAQDRLVAKVLIVILWLGGLLLVLEALHGGAPL